MDSIAQASGRCNRHGYLDTAEVHIVNPENETIQQLVDIKEGQRQCKRVLSELNGKNILEPEVMNRYFGYYFHERSDQMTYPLTENQIGRTDSLLNLLSENNMNIGTPAHLHLKQSFMTAGNAFRAIDAPTHAVIVPYKYGEHLITELCSINMKFDIAGYRACLRQSQKYSVNVFPNVWRNLIMKQAVHEIHEGAGVYCLDKKYYSSDFGLSAESIGHDEVIIL